jgi:hypothetical protein
MPIKGLISKCAWNIEVLRQAGKIEFELSCRLEIVGEQQNGKTDWLACWKKSELSRKLE